VFIGENGCGKSNILEAIALAGAAAGNKLDNEFLAPRGIRVTEPEFMRSAFDKENLSKEIKISLKRDEKIILKYIIQNDNADYSKWKNVQDFNNYTQLPDKFKEDIWGIFVDFLVTYSHNSTLPANSLSTLITPDETNFSADKDINQLMTNLSHGLDLKDFLIYSPENSLLRTFVEEGQIQPLGNKILNYIKIRI
jgi:AAA15 family ATPase/GTPase